MYKSVKGYSNLATSILLALLLVAMSWSSIGDNVHYDGYKLIFSDEFNQADGSQPDSMKWTICNKIYRKEAILLYLLIQKYIFLLRNR